MRVRDDLGWTSFKFALEYVMSEKIGTLYKASAIAISFGILGGLSSHFATSYLFAPSVDHEEMTEDQVTVMTARIDESDVVIRQQLAEIEGLKRVVSNLNEMNDDMREKNSISLAKIAELSMEIAQLKAAGTPDVQHDIETSSVGAESYIDNLERKISALSKMNVADMNLETLEQINAEIAILDHNVELYVQGHGYELTDSQQAVRDDYLTAILDYQESTLPAIRDAFGPAMRREMSDGQYSFVTTGEKYRTIEIMSDSFADMERIQTYHSKLHAKLVGMHFEQAVYMDRSGNRIFGTVEFPEISDRSLLQNDVKP